MKRNEIAIFEDFKLKPEKNLASGSNNTSVDKKELKKIILYRDNHQTNFFWRKENDGSFSPVDKFGSFDFIKANQPNPKNLTKFDTKLLASFNQYGWPIEWWAEDKYGQLIKVYSKKQKNLIEKEKDSLDFKVNAWIRDEAIKMVGLEIRKLKKKAYEYSKEELENLILDKERDLIKKTGWKVLKTVALSSLGLGFLPFI